MPSTRPGDERTGHADSPRQDTQRPEHGDHADAGGKESTNRRAETTQIPSGERPAEAPPVAGRTRPDPPLPAGGRQPERPGQPGEVTEGIGDRDFDPHGKRRS
jgi:hypothetical protein